MLINYDSGSDLLYIQLDKRIQQLTNVTLSENIVLDLGEENRIVGIEIMNASKNIELSSLLPIEYQLPKAG